MASYNFYDANLFANKRMKNNQGQSVVVAAKNTPPSCVVHVRGLVDFVTDQDLAVTAQRYGPVSFIMNFPLKKMALIEFERIESAITLVTHSQTHEVMVAGVPASFNYSISDRIKRPDHTVVESQANHVILLTILNPRHQITVDVIHAICSPIAPVVKIVIFRKNGIQVLVEFESIEHASKAKEMLHGADIYANSCTIKAEYAKPTSLNVRRNDLNTWDYTATHLTPTYNVMKNKPLLADPGMPEYGQPRQPFNYAMPPSEGAYNAYGAAISSRQPMLEYDSHAALDSSFMALDPQCYQEPNCVLMVYGINGIKFNCQKLFNLFCLYGDVIRIRFLKSKEGSAMVQMSDRDGFNRVMLMLKDVTCFEQKVVISPSKQAYVTESTSPPYPLTDGTNSFQDFTNSKNNRFGTPDALRKYRLEAPTKLLYFFNATPKISEETLKQAFIKVDAVPPMSVTLLPSRSEKSSRGYLNFESVETATDSLISTNNTKLQNPIAPAPYVLKLAFSKEE